MKTAKEKPLYSVRISADSGSGQGVARVEALAVFRQTIGGRRFEFFVHNTVSGAGFSLSEKSTGLRVAPVPVAARINYGRPDYKSAGRAALARVIDRVGEEKTAAVMLSARENRGKVSC